MGQIGRPLRMDLQSVVKFLYAIDYPAAKAGIFTKIKCLPIAFLYNIWYNEPKIKLPNSPLAN